MGLLDSMRNINEACPFETAAESARPVTPSVSSWDHPDEDSQAWLDRYATFSARPKFNPNMDGYISPYVGGHWGATSEIMQSIAAGAELGPLQEKLDPNRIFTSELAALKTLAADQIKVKKVFERKLMEILNDKGKYGLTEDDIAAMQALTSAASAIAAIDKEQIAVKKAIAELKIKQMQSGVPTQGPQTTTVRGSSAFDVGRSIMDDIFKVTATQPSTSTVVNANFPDVDVEQAAAVLDNITNTGVPDSVLSYEADKPKIAVVVGDRDESAKFVAYNNTGDVLEDYPLPDTKISTIDRDAKKAVDDLLQEYPVIYVSETGMSDAIDITDDVTDM